METKKQYIYQGILNNTENKNIYISQKDFNNGTFIISKSGNYILTENIIFNPNCPDFFSKSILENKNNLDWLPTNKQLENDYKHSSFVLGFYSAINIECDNVIIDLNGFMIEQHPLHCLQQRFFQIIQLNNSPFIKNQGPTGVFSKDGFIATTNILIKNGTLGRSSHYSIHGNDNTNLILENLLCTNFESGGIALNNVDNLFIDNVTIKKNRRDIPVKGSYSVLRTMKITYKKCEMNLLNQIEFNQEKCSKMFKNLLKLERRIISNYIINEFQSIKSRYLEDEIEKEINDFFYNKNGLSDGSVLTGIQITPKGVAIHGFEKKTFDLVCCSNTNEFNNKYSENIYIRNVKIQNLIAKPEEVISCKHKDKTINGVFGDKINMLQFVNSDGKYKKSILNDCICGISKIIKIDKQIISTINLPDWLINWTETNNNIGYYKEKIEILYGFDIMGHTNKGCIGIRIGGTKNIHLCNVVINHIHNIGNQSLKNITFLKENKSTAQTNVEDETGIDYAGVLSIGIILSNCYNISGCSINIQNIFSKEKQKYKILYNDSEKIHFH